MVIIERSFNFTESRRGVTKELLQSDTGPSILETLKKWCLKVAHSCHPSSLEADAKEFGAYGQPEPRGQRLEGSLGFKHQETLSQNEAKAMKQQRHTICCSII